MAKSAQRIEARKLRGIGESIIVIAKKLKVSKGSVSRWCRDIDLTDEQISKLINNSKKGLKRGCFVAAELKRKEQVWRKSKFKKIGKCKIGSLSKRELFILGSGLYWAEGAKKHRRTSFANSDPKMILIYLKWLKECLKISRDRIYCHVSINQDHKGRIREVEEYWSKTTGISRKFFNKTSYKRVKNKKFYANFNNHYGTLFVMVRRGTNLNYEILGTIEGLKKNAS